MPMKIATLISHPAQLRGSVFVPIARTVVAIYSAWAISVCHGGWIRFSATRPIDSPNVPFGIASTEEDDSGLSATAWYRYIEGRSAVTIHGKKGDHDVFRPNVSYEVADGDRDTWLRVPTARNEETFEGSIVLDRKRPSAELVFSMEPFRKLIGFAKRGRIVLENGDVAVFQLDDLLPTHPASDCGEGDFKASVTESDENKRKAGFHDAWISEPAHLVAVRSQHGELTGVFDFRNRESAVVKLDGGRTIDGDFWPLATLHVSQLGTDWEKISEAKSNGGPATLSIALNGVERLRVYLTPYRPFCGRYKYGKVVFSNGGSAFFSLEALWKGEGGN